MKYRRRKMNRHKRAFALLLIFLLSFAANMEVYAEDGIPHFEALQETLYEDPTGEFFIYETYDKEKTSNIYYRTQGFTIADAYKDENGNIVETGGGKEITFALNNPSVDGVSEPTDKAGIIKTTWKIPKSVVMEQIKAASPEWYGKIVNPSGEIYLKLDAVLAVQDKHKYEDIYGTGEAWSGFLDENGNYIGELFDKHNYELLKDLYGWNPSYFDNHFDKALMIALGLIEDDNNPNKGAQPPAMLDADKYPTPGGEMVDIIGKRAPEFRTYNYDPTGKFNIGQMNGGGIPTSEDITNGYNANEWYGWAGITDCSAQS